MEITMNDHLPDDIFLDIFSYLSLYDLCKAELACQEWRRLILVIWSKLRKLHISKLLNVKPLEFCQIQYYVPRIGDGGLRNLATRCGANLIELCIGCKLKLDLACLNILALEFPQLQILDLSKMIPVFFMGEEGERWPEFKGTSTFDHLRTIRMDACFDDSALAYCTFECVDPFLFKFFTKMPNLESVSLAQNTLFNGTCLLGLTANVRSLDLGFCRRTTAETLALVFGNLPNLTHVSLYSNNRLTGDCLSHLTPNLESIDLSYCDSLTTDTLIEFFRTHPQLRSLQLAHVQGVTNDVLSAITEYSRNLENLNLSCYMRTYYYEHYQHRHEIEEGVKTLASMKGLKQLDLNKNEFVHDATLIGIAYGCRMLEELSVSQLTNVGPMGFADLGRLSRLKKLDISGNDCIDQAVLLSVASGGNLEFVNARQCTNIDADMLKNLGHIWPNPGTIFQIF